MIYKQGDIVLIPFPFTDAKTAKKRPALVISNKEHHITYGKYVCIAITSQKSATKRYEHSIVKWQEANLKKPSYAVIEKVFSTEAQYIEKLYGELDTGELATIMELFNTMIK